MVSNIRRTSDSFVAWDVNRRSWWIQMPNTLNLTTLLHNRLWFCSRWVGSSPHQNKITHNVMWPWAQDLKLSTELRVRHGSLSLGGLSESNFLMVHSSCWNQQNKHTKVFAAFALELSNPTHSPLCKHIFHYFAEMKKGLKTRTWSLWSPLDKN